jgi:hypothetical protein
LAPWTTQQCFLLSKAQGIKASTSTILYKGCLTFNRICGAMSFSITTLSIMTLNITIKNATLIITALDTVMLMVIMLFVVYTECRKNKPVILSVIMLNVVMLNVVMLVVVASHLLIKIQIIIATSIFMLNKIPFFI